MPGRSPSDTSERDREAVCGQREERQVGLLGPQAVTGLATRARLGAVHERRVNLPVECEPQSGSAPISAHSRRRFSSTRSTSSPLMRPRLSEANGPSLTPPARVEKATSYGPGGRQRIIAPLPLGFGEQPLALVQRRVADHAGEQMVERRAEPGPGCQPSSIRSLPSTASWSSRCGLSSSRTSVSWNRSRRSSSSSSRVVRALPLALEVGSLVRPRDRTRARRRGGGGTSAPSRCRPAMSLRTCARARSPGRVAGAWPDSAAGSSTREAIWAPISSWPCLPSFGLA